MSTLEAHRRRMWRAALRPSAILSLDEVADALPGPPADARVWAAEQVGPVGHVAGLAVYRWGDVLAELERQRASQPALDGGAGPGPAASPPSLAPSAEGESLLDAAEVAALLNVPQAQIAALRAAGLPSFKIGHRTVRFARSEVLSWLRQTVVAGTEECSHDSQKERRRVVRRLPIHGPCDGQDGAIQAFDWTQRGDQEGGRGGGAPVAARGGNAGR